MSTGKPQMWQLYKKGQCKRQHSRYTGCYTEQNIVVCHVAWRMWTRSKAASSEMLNHHLTAFSDCPKRKRDDLKDKRLQAERSGSLVFGSSVMGKGPLSSGGDETYWHLRFHPASLPTH